MTRDYAKGEARLRRAASVAVDRVAGVGRCPGWKRPCGITSPRALCYFCQRSKDQEKENR